MAKFNFDDFAANLPDAFRKDKDSNNYKLLQIEKYIYDKIYNMLYSVDNVLDIDNTTGKALDEIWGSRLNLKRGALNDTQYRIRLKARIAQSLSDGSRDSVANALAYVLSSTADRIKLKCDDIKINTINIVDIPMALLTEAKFSADEITQMVEDLLAVGIHVSQANFSGTFEFAENETTYDESKGFANDAGTIGGYLGLLMEG